MAGGEVQLGSSLPKIPESLLLARDRGQVLFVVGAGASYPPPTALPDFAGLVADIYREIDLTTAAAIDAMRVDRDLVWNKVSGLFDDRQRTELKFFQQREYDVVLGMLERRHDGASHSESTMRRAAHKVLSRTKNHNPVHSSLVRLGQRHGRTLLATTNFDRLLSVAARELKLTPTAFALGAMPSPSRSSEFAGIMHIHGMLALGREPASSIILTDQDFGDAYLRRHSITSFLYDAARIFSLVLVGYSASDSPVRYLLNAIAGDERHFDDLKPRYAFVGHSPSDTRTPVEWSSRGINPISYDDTSGHEPLGHALSRWADLIPEKNNRSNIDSALNELIRKDPSTADGETASGLFKYFVRRSTSVELVELSRYLTAMRAGRWINLLTETLREDQGKK